MGTSKLGILFCLSFYLSNADASSGQCITSPTVSLSFKILFVINNWTWRPVLLTLYSPPSMTPTVLDVRSDVSWCPGVRTSPGGQTQAAVSCFHLATRAPRRSVTWSVRAGVWSVGWRGRLWPSSPGVWTPTPTTRSPPSPGSLWSAPTPCAGCPMSLPTWWSFRDTGEAP